MKILVLQKSKVLEIETQIRLIHDSPTSFDLEDLNFDPLIYSRYHSGLNYPCASCCQQVLHACECHQVLQACD